MRVREYRKVAPAQGSHTVRSTTHPLLKQQTVFSRRSSACFKHILERIYQCIPKHTSPNMSTHRHIGQFCLRTVPITRQKMQTIETIESCKNTEKKKEEEKEEEKKQNKNKIRKRRKRRRKEEEETLMDNLCSLFDSKQLMDSSKRRKAIPMQVTTSMGPPS